MSKMIAIIFAVLFVGWAKAQCAVPTYTTEIAKVGTLALCPPYGVSRSLHALSRNVAALADRVAKILQQSRR